MVISECTPPGFTFLNAPRDGNDSHGDLAVIFNSTLKLSFANNIVNARPTFELACVTDPTMHAIFMVVYRPPPSTRNRLKTSDFLHDFERFLSEVILLPSRIIMLGDFSVHVDTPSKSEASQFLTSLSDCCLHQHINGPTRSHS